MDEQSIIDEWKKDSQSFDTVANLYDEFRPEYPPELVEAVINLSGIMDGGRILEIGSGTGKATRLFARRGYLIHCIEQGRNLATVAARNLQEWPGVTFETNRFEESQRLLLRVRSGDVRTGIPLGSQGNWLRKGCPGFETRRCPGALLEHGSGVPWTD